MVKKKKFSMCLTRCLQSKNHIYHRIVSLWGREPPVTVGYKGHLTATLNAFTFCSRYLIICPNTRDYRTTDDFEVVPATPGLVFQTSALTAIRAASKCKCVICDGETQTLNFALFTVMYNDAKDNIWEL
jgi:hypothetical protein